MRHNPFLELTRTDKPPLANVFCEADRTTKLGTRRLHKRLVALGVAHVYEELADDHTAVDYRMDVSLPSLA